MNSGTIIQTITDELTYDTLHSSEDNLWSVLLMTGYITKANAEEEGETVSLKIPNREIASIFEDTVVKLFKETIDTNMQKSMMEAFWNKDEDNRRAIIIEAKKSDREADLDKDCDEAIDQVKIVIEMRGIIPLTAWNIFKACLMSINT